MHIFLIMRFSFLFPAYTLQKMSKNSKDAVGVMERKSWGAITAGYGGQSGLIAFVMGSLVLGTIGVFVHEAGVDPLTATWFRCAFGLLGLSAWMVWRRQMGHLRASLALLRWVIASGICMVLAWGLFFAAIPRTSAGVATMLFHIQPLWVLMLGRWFLKERLAPQRLFAVALAMIGLLLATDVLTHTGGTAGNTASYWWGVAWCMLGAFCTACVAIIARYLGAMPAGILAWWQCLVGTLALLVWPVTQGLPAWGVGWAWLSGLGLLHTAMAYSLLYAGMAKLSSDRIAVLQFIYPAVVLLVDWLVYDHTLGRLQLAGLGLMAVAIWVAEKPSKHPFEGNLQSS
jgi:drug/metabolite transporter (DMT)-like permease